MFQKMIGASDIEKGLLLMLIGILGVFLVLLIFYFLIRGLMRLFPYKEEKGPD